MTKRLSVITGEYQDRKTGEQKGEWKNVGILGVDKNGNEYVLLEPDVSIAGLLIKQNALAAKKGEAQRDMLMTKVFDSQQGQQQQSTQQSAPQQQGGYQQPQQQGGFQQPQQQQGGFQQQGGYQQQPGK